MTTKPMNTTDAAIARLRDRIDDLDGELLDVLARRGELVQQIGRLKRQAGLPMVDAARRRHVVEAVARDNPGPYSDNDLAALMGLILDASPGIMERDSGD